MSETDRCIFSGMQILVNDRWEKNQAIVVDGGRIKAIIPVEMIQHHLPAKTYAFPPDHFLVPGFIDLHVHGAQGHDVMDGTEEALKEISNALAAEGVTGFLATTMTAGKQQVETVLQLVPTLMQNKNGAAILGIHLEGPFIASAKMGAQPKEYIIDPDAILMRHWLKLSQSAIKVVTVAPEIPGALQLIKLLRSLEVVVSIGHTNATFAETKAAISAGCTQATHLFNAMSGIQHREPGAAGAILLADEVTAEMIVDGVHLHPAVVDLAYSMKGKDRLLLVTDSMRAKCLGDGVYDLGGQRVEVSRNKAMLADGTLAGSLLKMPDAIKNMVDYSGCSLPEAIAMAARNPARILGLEDKKGSISVGKDADLVVLDAKFSVLLTLRAGVEVYAKHQEVSA